MKKTFEERRQELNQKLDVLVQEMKSEARAYNKYLTLDYLNKRSFRQLLTLTHPMERRDYARRHVHIQAAAERLGEEEAEEFKQEQA